MANSIKFLSGSVFTMLTIVTQDGTPLDVALLNEEPLETPGANGRRWRTVNQQHKTFEVRTLAEAATYAAAIVLAENYLRAAQAQRVVTLAIGTKVWNGVHVSDCQPVAVPGQVVAAAAGASSQATVVCRWLLEFTDFPLS